MTNREWLEKMDNEQLADFCYHVLFHGAEKYKTSICTAFIDWLKGERDYFETLPDEELAKVMAEVLCFVYFRGYDSKSQDAESFFENDDNNPSVEEDTPWLIAWLKTDRKADWSKRLLEIAGFEVEPVTNDR